MIIYYKYKKGNKMNNEFVSKEQKIKLMNLSIEEKVKIDTIEEAR